MKEIVILIFVFAYSNLYSVEKLPLGNEKAAMVLAKKYLPDNPIILECGAYDGTDTLRMIEVWPNAIIHTFEPVPCLFDIVKNKTKDHLNIYAHQYALGDFCGKSIFYLSNVNGEQSASSSLLPPDRHEEFDEWVKFWDIIEVDVITLDFFSKTYGVPKFDFLWLDMQGYELNMLQVSEIAKQAKVIYTEIEFVQLYKNQYLYTDVLKWMIENGFELVAMDCNPFSLPFGNAMFVKNNLL